MVCRGGGGGMGGGHWSHPDIHYLSYVRLFVKCLPYSLYFLCGDNLIEKKV